MGQMAVIHLELNQEEFYIQAQRDYLTKKLMMMQ